MIGDDIDGAGRRGTASAGDDPQARAAEMRRVALGMLGRREYARAELQQRLTRRFGEDAPVGALLDWLEAQRFLDDTRYAGMLVRSRIERGQGPLRIRQALQQNGVGNLLAEQALAEAGCDWFALAAETCRRRFGAGPPADLKDKARRLRFLQYRGFTADQCFEALDGDGAAFD